jgi:hypothetical protein
LELGFSCLDLISRIVSQLPVNTRGPAVSNLALISSNLAGQQRKLICGEKIDGRQ